MLRNPPSSWVRLQFLRKQQHNSTPSSSQGLHDCQGDETCGTTCAGIVPTAPPAQTATTVQHLHRRRELPFLCGLILLHIQLPSSTLNRRGSPGLIPSALLRSYLALDHCPTVVKSSVLLLLRVKLFLIRLGHF